MVPLSYFYHFVNTSYVNNTNLNYLQLYVHSSGEKRIRQTSNVLIGSYEICSLKVRANVPAVCGVFIRYLHIASELHPPRVFM